MESFLQIFDVIFWTISIFFMGIHKSIYWHRELYLISCNNNLEGKRTWKRIYMYTHMYTHTYNWITFMYTQNIVHQLRFDKKHLLKSTFVDHLFGVHRPHSRCVNRRGNPSPPFPSLTPDSPLPGSPSGPAAGLSAGYLRKAREGPPRPVFGPRWWRCHWGTRAGLRDGERRAAQYTQVTFQNRKPWEHCLPQSTVNLDEEKLHL